MAHTLASSSLSAPSGGDRSLIQEAQWQEETLQSSANVDSQGTPLPIVWLGVEGTIPDGAVPYYEDSTGPLYIARSLIEGEYYLGVVGPSTLPGGAIISYNGRNHIMNQYEVLVCLSYLRWSMPSPYNTRPTSSPVASQGNSAEYPMAPANLNERQHVQLKHLAVSKTVFLIDNTLSMSRWWNQLENALGGVADALGQASDWEGADILFMHSEATHAGLKTRVDFQHTLRTTPRCDEAKNVAPKLANIVDGYFSNAESKKDGWQRTSILILTDGSPADQNETVDVIVEAVRRLEENKVGGNLFRIYVLQVGDDRTVASPLRKISNEVAQETHGKGILTILSYHRGRGLLNSKHILSVLLLHTELPAHEDPDAAPQEPDEVVHARVLETKKLMKAVAGLHR